MKIKKIIECIIGQDNYIKTCLLIKRYSFFPLKKSDSNIVVAASNGSGLADRLRGMISVYAYAKVTHKRFFIEHETPFKLSDYLEPNVYNWRDEQSEITHNIFYAMPIVFTDHATGDFLFEKKHKKQEHIYTNVNILNVLNNKYKTSFTYHDLYQELFKPSERLKQASMKYIDKINEGYISVSFRFLQLMGDFKDGIGEVLPPKEQMVLLEKCKSFLISLKNKHTDIKNILVTSDSQKLIEYISDIDFVFTIEGKIGHIQFIHSDDVILKTFLDFYMISQAKKVYMAYSGQMYKSKFSQSAAETTGVPFESINF